MDPWGNASQNAHIDFHLTDISCYIERQRQLKIAKEKQLETKVNIRAKLIQERRNGRNNGCPHLQSGANPRNTSEYPDPLSSILSRAKERSERRKKMEEARKFKELEEEKRKIEFEKFRCEEEKLQQRQKLKMAKDEQKLKKMRDEKRRQWDAKLDVMKRKADVFYRNYLLKTYFRKFKLLLLHYKSQRAKAEAHYQMRLMNGALRCLFINSKIEQQNKHENAEKMYNNGLMRKALRQLQQVGIRL